MSTETQELWGVRWGSVAFGSRGKFHLSTEERGDALCGHQSPGSHDGRGNCSLAPEHVSVVASDGQVCKHCLNLA